MLQIYFAFSCLLTNILALYVPNHEASSTKNRIQPEEHVKSEKLSDLRLRSEQTVDLNSIPVSKCTLPQGVLKPYCADQPPGFVDCPLVPCEGDSESGCQTYSLECFCQSPSALRCAWSCDWRGWMYVEDWFRDTCPEVQPVDFSPLPSCARNCIESNSLNYGCVSQSKNCFCLEGNLFNCTDNCKHKADVESIAYWYSNLCSLTNASSFDTVYSGNGSFQFNAEDSGHKQAIVIERPTPNRLQWYEILVIFTLVFTFVVACLWSFALYIFKRTWKLSKKEEEELEARREEQAKRQAIKDALDHAKAEQARKAEEERKQFKDAAKAKKAKDKAANKATSEQEPQTGGIMGKLGLKSNKDGKKVVDEDKADGLKAAGGEKGEGRETEATLKNAHSEKIKPVIEDRKSLEEDEKVKPVTGPSVARFKDGSTATQESVVPGDGKKPKTLKELWNGFAHRYFDFGLKIPESGKKTWRYYLGLRSADTVVPSQPKG